jgi:hypothetical protein
VLVESRDKHQEGHQQGTSADSEKPGKNAHANG